MIINIYISPGQPLSGFRFVQSVNGEFFYHTITGYIHKWYFTPFYL